MTDEDRTQLQKDVLYDEYLVRKEYGEYLAKIEMAEERLRDLHEAFSEHIAIFRGVMKPEQCEKGDYRKYIVNFEDLEKSFDRLIELGKRLTAISERKKLLGLGV
jgi:hypothetical protein